MFGRDDSRPVRADMDLGNGAERAAQIDFAIVGAPRCSTTAMSQYLAEHPDVCFADPKEPHYFAVYRMDDMDVADIAEKVKAEYMSRFFAHSDGTEKLRGEGSVSYLYSPWSAQTILRLNPDARFIIMLRNPIEMVQSYHAQTVYMLDEDLTDLKDAWRIQDRRAKGEAIPATCRDANLLRYADIGRFGKFLEEFMEVAGPGRCLPVIFDDFIADPRGTYLKVLAHLGLEDDGRTEFPVVKASRRYRWLWLHKLLKRPPQFILNMVGGAGPTAARTGSGPWKKSEAPAILGLRSRLLEFNKVDNIRPPLDPDLRAEMIETWADDNARLGKLLGRDLSHWMK